MSILGSNANGIGSKINSLLDNVTVFNPSIITIQETKVRKKRSIKIPGFEPFENIRSDHLGGGLFTGIDVNLDPVIVSSDNENETEILTVQFRAGDIQFRVINAYGPQESNTDVLEFWQSLESEIISAKDNNCKIIIQLDANAKVGKQVIKEDPNDVTANGQLLLDLVKRQNLRILNTLDVCDGVITRERKRLHFTEKSVIDYIITCEDLSENVQHMLIDDDRKYTLTR